mgnify:CR=1 FL=1
MCELYLLAGIYLIFKMRKTIEILVGIPCSGKTTYTKEKCKCNSVLSVSRDEIRENRRSFPIQPYIYTRENENRVTEIFNRDLLDYLRNKMIYHVILDNTHTKEGYIDAIIKEWGDECNIKIKFFDIPLYKAFYRNIIRNYKTGKFIPFSAIYNMYNNYNKINKKKYAKYLV